MDRKLLLVVASIVLALVAPPAGASERSPAEVCAMFPYVQTYRGESGFYRAPAWHYGRTVMVRYIASSCKVTASSIDVAGTAIIYKGGTLGAPSVAKGFSFSLDWQTPRGARNWPIAWWACSKTRVDYGWTIAGVYDFSLTNRGGLWHATQRSLGQHPTESSVSVSGCT
jgi:hypothetical protein